MVEGSEHRRRRQLAREAHAEADPHPIFAWFADHAYEAPARWARLPHGLFRCFRGDELAVRRVPALSLATLLTPLDRVDIIDVDIQGAEADVLEPAARELDARVRRVYVGTHNRHVESRLRILFGDLGWDSVYDYPNNSTSDTPWGRIIFEDGAQSWLNPRL